MQILSIKIKNFLSISDVEISPGQINQIVGSNNAGKTTILKALDFIFKGSTDGNLVKFGEESAEVFVELDDKTSIRRKLNSDGKQNVSVKVNGFSAPSPQDYLNALTDLSAFNPLEILDPKNRTAAIMKTIDLKVSPELLAQELGCDVKDLPPVDYDQHGMKVLEQVHKYYYLRRAEANKDMSEKKKRWETYKADLPKVEAKPLPNEQEINSAVQTLSEKLGDVNAQLNGINAIVDLKNKTLKELQGLKENAAKWSVDIANLQSWVKANELEQIRLSNVTVETELKIQNVDPLQEERGKLLISIEQEKAKLKDIETSKAIEKQVAMVEQHHGTFLEAEKYAAILTEKVDALAGKVKTKLLSSAELPVEGLEYKNSEFFINGASIDNLSSSHSLKLAIAVARKLAKKTKLICIDGSELLDEEMFKTLHSEIKDDGYTYFLSKVGQAFESEGDKIFKIEKGAIQ
jgi:ABC-type polar amino acid transport system ATPase subunit